MSGRDANQLAGGMLAAALRARGRHPGYLEQAALDLAAAAERVDNNFMGNGVAFQRDALRYHIGFTRDEVNRSRGIRRRD